MELLWVRVEPCCLPRVYKPRARPSYILFTFSINARILSSQVRPKSHLKFCWEVRASHREVKTRCRMQEKECRRGLQSMFQAEIFVVGFLLLFSSDYNLYYSILPTFRFFLPEKKHECHLLVEPFFSLNYTSLSFFFVVSLRLSITLRMKGKGTRKVWKWENKKQWEGRLKFEGTSVKTHTNISIDCYPPK